MNTLPTQSEKLTIGELVDSILELVPQLDHIETLKTLVNNFGFYSSNAQYSILLGTYMRAKDNTLNPHYACDAIILRNKKV